MSELDLIEKLAQAVAVHITPAISPDIDLWDNTMIAAYFKRDPQVTRQTIACLPSFPKAIRLPTSRKSQPLYKANEVIAWAEQFKDKN